MPLTLHWHSQLLGRYLGGGGGLWWGTVDSDGGNVLVPHHLYKERTDL